MCLHCFFCLGYLADSRGFEPAVEPYSEQESISNFPLTGTAAYNTYERLFLIKYCTIKKKFNVGTIVLRKKCEVCLTAT